jgi:myo-inositol-1(or 4)-monophosphatase
MNNWNIDEVLNIIAECGQIAIKYYDNPGYELKADKSIVTDADKAIEDYLMSNLNNPAENAYMIGEETILSKDEEYISNALKGNTWIIDPIDGTAPYSHHIPTWGISIAFMQNGIIKEGAIYLPVIGELYISYNDKIYYNSNLHNKANIELNDLKEFNPVKRKNISLISLTQEITKYNTTNISNPVQSICSAVFSMTQLMQRRYMGYILSKYIKIWDFAAGLYLLQKTGILTKYKDGTKLTLSVSELCNLNKSGIDRWKLKSEAVFTLTEKDFSYISENISF